MSVTDLLSILYLTTPTACAMMEGRRAGITGIAIGTVVGVGFGIAGFVAVRAVIKRAALRPKLGPGTTPFWKVSSTLLCYALFLGIIVSGLLAGFLVQVLVGNVVA